MLTVVVFFFVVVVVVVVVVVLCFFLLLGLNSNMAARKTENKRRPTNAPNSASLL